MIEGRGWLLRLTRSVALPAIAVMYAVLAQLGVASAATYVGSGTCLACHNGTVAANKTGWHETLHANLYRPAVPENIIAVFTGTVKLADAASGTPETEFTLDNGGGSGPFTVSFLGQSFEVARAHGGASIARNADPAALDKAGHSSYIGKQRYQVKVDGKYYVLPLQWNPVPDLDGKKKGWVQYNLKNWVTKDGTFQLPLGASEEQACAGCHQTGVVPATGANGYVTMTAKEENITCEACHGPGSDHVTAATPEARKATIINPRNLALDRANEVCGQCHYRGRSVGDIGGKKMEYGYSSVLGRSFIPGDVLGDFLTDEGGYWPDGTSQKHHQQWEDYQKSKHFTEGGLACFDCHKLHGEGAEHDLKLTARDNSLCLSCHSGSGPAKAFPGSEAAHSLHKADPVNDIGRCTSCHMPAVQSSAVSYDIHAHTFEALSPQKTLDQKVPNSCGLCHRGNQHGEGAVDTKIADWGEASDVTIAQWALSYLTRQVTAVADLGAASLPAKYALEQNFPNPFNPSTHIRYDVAKSGRVTLAVYDVLGQPIRTLIDGERSAGRYVAVWDGKDNAGLSVASGAYFYRLTSGEFSAMKRMAIVK